MIFSHGGERLLRIVSKFGGTIEFDTACQSLGASARELRALVTELGPALEPVQPMAMRPDYRITPSGRAMLGRIGDRTPSTIVRTTLWSEPGSENLLSVILEQDGERRASGRTMANSYQLAAMRYMLALQPDGLASTSLTSAGILIGAALQPACRRCAQSADSTCENDVNCVRGAFTSIRRSAEAAGRWLAAELVVHSPWTHVPWEMAAFSADDFLALDRSVSLFRRSHPSNRWSDTGLFGAATVLVLVVEVVPGEFAAEAEELRAVIDATVDGACSLRPHVATVTSTDEIAEQVEAREPQVVHVLGHGAPSGIRCGFNSLEKGGVAAAISRADVRLVILATCFGAISNGPDPTHYSLAAEIVARGTPNVLATDGLAEGAHLQRCASAMYSELARSGGVDLAVHEGRAAMRTGAPFYQWGQLVLVRP